MCLEDLRLGKGRQFGPPVFTSGSVASILPADANRVALIISFRGLGIFDSVTPTQVIDYAQIAFAPSITIGAHITIGPGPILIVLRIEDVGQLIQQAVSVNVVASSGQGFLTLTPITSLVEATPIERGRP